MDDGGIQHWQTVGQQEEWEALEAYEQQRKDKETRGQPSPVNDGIFDKEIENGIHRN